MNEFVQKTTGSGCSEAGAINSSSYGPKGIVMDYYDGNTVTGLWNYAQHYCAQRQLLRQPVRSVLAGSDQPHQRRH